jgi:dienelactone hydrolase
MPTSAANRGRIFEATQLICIVAIALALWATPLRAQAPGTQTVIYNLGEATIDQTWLPRRDDSRRMPYRVEGVIAMPAGRGPFPLVLIFHGAHGGCPLDQTSSDVPTEKWPCKPEEEQRNDLGLSYLATALAARGYIALAPNLNAVYASAYRSVGAELRRYPDVLDAHLNALVAANADGEGTFGVSLQGKIDFERIGVIGYAHGSLLAMQSARARETRSRSRRIPEGSGQFSGVLLVAPLYSSSGDADVPLGVLLPECDGETPDLNGQGYYEDARMRRERTHFAASIYLTGANHNFFNDALTTDDAEALRTFPSCNNVKQRLTRAQQRLFLTLYAPDFFDAAMGAGELSVNAGLDLSAPAPDDVYASRVLTALSLPTDQRRIVIRPRIRDDLGYNEFGGFSQTRGASKLEFCEYRMPCARWPFQPGNPAGVRFVWNDPIMIGWEMPLDEGGADLSRFSMLHLRVVPDPTDALNTQRKPIAIRLTLTDANNRTATVILNASDTPALAHPVGRPDVGTWRWAGHAYLSSIRAPLSAFKGINLARVTTLDLSIASDSSGSLLVADIEFLSPALGSAAQ